MSPQATDCQAPSRRTLSVLLAALLAVSALGFAAAPVMAQTTDPTDAQYDPVDQTIDSGLAGGDEGDAGSPGGPTGSAAAADGLPFTGLDVALAGVVGALLLGTGLVMRRASRAPGASA